MVLPISGHSDLSTSKLIVWKRLFWSSLPSWKSQCQENAAQVGFVLLLLLPGWCSNTLNWQMSKKFRASKWSHVPCSFWKKSHLRVHVKMETGPQWILERDIHLSPLMSSSVLFVCLFGNVTTRCFLQVNSSFSDDKLEQSGWDRIMKCDATDENKEKVNCY